MNLPKYTKLAALLTAVLCCSLSSFAQLSARFSASSISGCSPVVAHFTDASTGNPTQWRWELGNGVVSTLQNPSTTYFNPGTYTVKLFVRNASGADSLIKTSYVTVYANPVVDFAASDTSGCFPLPVQFKDGSAVANSTITSWSWDFGDGSLSTQQHPTHTYTAAGAFTVSLKVTTDNGCTKTLSKQQYIRPAVGVIAGFQQSATANCAAPFTVQFTDTSNGAGSLGYVWNFGDGASSTLQHPSHVYTKTGAYSVSLVAVSPQGCRDTILKQNLVNIGTRSDFTYGAACAATALQFSNTTQPQPTSSAWFFGDGTTSTAANPTKVYAAAGVYTVKLVNYFNGCADSVTKTITVQPRPAAAFIANKTAGCQIPSTVNFTASGAAGSYEWNFGDSGTATGISPTHVYSAEGAFTVTLIVTNANGCSDTLTKPGYIKIARPIIVLDSLPKTGCVPLLVKPSFSIVSNDAIVSYHWNFGDGSTSNDSYPSHTYTTAGNYAITLTITTRSGCTETVSMKDAVRCGNKPTAAFLVQPADVCASQPVQFIDSSRGACDQWLWDFGDNHTSTEQNPLHVMAGLGHFNVTLVVWSNTCADTLRIENAVNVRPPLSLFKMDRDCEKKYVRSFTNHSVGDTSHRWDFGDGTTSTEENPVHTYAATGQFVVSLYVSNGSCTNINRDTFFVIDEHADFKLSKETLCKGEPLILTGFNINSAYIATWSWDFGDGTNSDNANTTSHQYASAGTYTIKLRIKDLLGCEDVKTATVTVYGPTAAFSLSAAVACLENNAIQFQDSSKTDGLHALLKWSWNFGDGATDTSATSVQHNFGQTGTYGVSLKVTDAYGCSDSLLKPAAVIIAKPVADFSSVDTVSCVDKPIVFINRSVGASEYSWNFGDGQQSIDADPSHRYAAIGTYTIGLKVTDQYGCTDVATKESYIAISFPKAKFTVSDSVGNCPPLQVNFTNYSTDYTSLAWDFGDGNTSTLLNPSHFYTVPGIFLAKLVVRGPGGCEAVYTRRIEVKGPTGTFAYGTLPTCKPAALTLAATTTNSTSIVWDFGDGALHSGKDSVVKHSYADAGEFVPKMILTDAAGCSFPVIGADTIKVIGVEADFNLNKTALCDSGVVAFANNMVSNDLITSWQWDFGDGTSSTDRDPSHRYTTTGVFNTRLSVTTQTGCIGISEQSPVSVSASPIVSITGDTAACVPASLHLKGAVVRGNAGTLNWNWNLSNGQMVEGQDMGVQQYLQDGIFPTKLSVKDDKGCTYAVTKNVTIHPLPATNAGADLTLCRDKTLQLNATGASRYVWQPSAVLSCLTCADPIVSATDTSIFIVTGYSAIGCAKNDTVKVAVRQRFQLEAMAMDTICTGSSLQLWAKGADLYQWSPGIGIDNPTSASPKVSPTVTTNYRVIATDKDHCFADTAFVPVKVYPIPVVSIGADVTMTAGGSSILKTTNSSDIDSWRWFPTSNLSCATCPSPTASPKATTTYKVQVRNAGGCTSSDDVTVSVICNNGNLFIPNTFSPNGDGSNDIFYPRGTGIHNIRSFRVFNRWGEVVFERLNFNANDAASGWDGTYKGKKLSPDVYIYTCEVICSNNEVLPFRGDVTLLQ